MDIQERKCSNCGAPLILGPRVSGASTWKCEYCGAIYLKRDDRYVVIQDSRCKTLSAKAIIPGSAIFSHIPEEDLARYTKNQLVHEIAEGLSNFIEINYERDIHTMDTIVRGYVRVVPPGFKY